MSFRVKPENYVGGIELKATGEELSERQRDFVASRTMCLMWKHEKKLTRVYFEKDKKKFYPATPYQGINDTHTALLSNVERIKK